MQDSQPTPSPVPSPGSIGGAHGPVTFCPTCGGPIGSSRGAPPAGRAALRMSPFARAIWISTLVLSGAGIWITWSLAKMHGHVDPNEKSLISLGCSPEWGKGVSCDQVLQSRWAKVPVGRLKEPYRRLLAAVLPGGLPAEIPVSWFGLAYFAAMGTWFVCVGQPSRSRWFYHLVPLVVIGIGALGSAGFLYLLLFRLPAICPLCVATHVVNFLLLLCTVLLWPRGADAEPHPRWKQVVTAAALVGLVVFAVFAIFTARDYAAVRGYANALEATVRKYEATPAYKRDLFEKAWEGLFTQKVYDIPVDADDPVLGPRSAPRTLAMFGDFQCGPCKLLHDHIREIWEDIQRGTASQGGVRLVFKHYPLYARCNPRSATNVHAYSCDAALAAEAARIVGGPDAFWKMADALFANQKDLDLAPYVRLAREIGLDVQAFEAARRSPEAAARVERHVRQGAAAEMSSTPGIFLDGVSIREVAGSGPSLWIRLLRQPNWPGLPHQRTATQPGHEADRQDPGTRPAPAR